MKILITYPPLLNTRKGFPLLTQNRQFQWFSNPTVIFPLVPASAATLLKFNGFKVLYKDALAEHCDWQEYLAYLNYEKPDLIAIETKTPVIKQHWAIIKKLKEDLKGISKFLLMGDHVTANPEESLQNCPELDFVLTGGDYDFSLLALCKWLQNQDLQMPPGFYYRYEKEIKSSGKFILNNNLDSLPFIDRELTRADLCREFNIKGRPYAYTMAGRDCPYHRCRFCSWRTLYPTFRVRSPNNLLDEIELLWEKYKVKEIFDDTGTLPNGAWLEDFCTGLVVRKLSEKLRFSCNFRFSYITEKNAQLMSKSGFRLLKFGLESANQKTLDRLDKNLKVEQIQKGCRIAKKAGLEVHITIMVGYPWETRQEAYNTLNLAKKLMRKGLADVLQSTLVIPYPGTPLYQEAIEQDWFLIDPHDYDRFDMDEAILKTPDLKPEEVQRICQSIYRKAFLSPGYIYHQIKQIRNWQDIRYLSRGFLAFLGHLKDFSSVRKN